MQVFSLDVHLHSTSRWSAFPPVPALSAAPCISPPSFNACCMHAWHWIYAQAGCCRRPMAILLSMQRVIDFVTVRLSMPRHRHSLPALPLYLSLPRIQASFANAARHRSVQPWDKHRTRTTSTSFLPCNNFLRGKELSQTERRKTSHSTCGFDAECRSGLDPGAGRAAR